MNTLKSFVRNITEKIEDRSPDSPSIGSNAEGFLCPICMHSFNDPEDLQSHFLSEHSTDEDDTDNPDTNRSFLPNDSSFESKGEEQNSIISEGSSVIRKTTPSGSASDYSFSHSKLTSPKDDSFYSEYNKSSGDCSNCQESAGQIENLKAKIESLDASLVLKDKGLEDAKKKLSTEANDFQDLIQSKNEEIRLLQDSVKDLKCDKSISEESEKAKIAELRSNYDQSQKELSTQSATLNALKKKYEDEKLEKDQLLCTNSEMECKITSSNKLIEDLRTQNSQFEEDRAELLKEIELGEGTNMALDQLKQENFQLSKQIKTGQATFEKTKEELQSRISQLNQELIEAKSKCSNLSDSLKETNDKVLTVTSNLDSESSASKELSKELKSKKHEIEMLNKKYKDLESKLNQASEKNLEVSIEKNNIATKAEKLTKANEDLKKSNDSFQEQSKEKGSLIEELNVKVKSLTEANGGFKTDLTKKEKEIQKHRNEAEKAKMEKESLAKELMTSKEDLQSANSKLILELDTVSKEREELEERICSLQKGYEVKIEGLNKSLNEAKISIDSYSSIKRECLDKLKTLEDECNALHSEKQSMSEGFKTQTAKLKTSISSLEKEKSNRVSFYENRINDLSSCLEKTTNDLNELSRESEKFQSIKSKLEKSVTETLSSRDFLLSQKLELEAQVGASNDERKALLERCLGAETELDRSRSNCIELRRKLDDSQAALHELGRENQSIQLELNKLTGRKWADDSDVKDCAGCQSAFSITIRKHHCRNCGQIFCKECSSKTSSNMTNYTKPQRVCDGCYEELAIK